MGYVDKTLLTVESIVFRTFLHWIIYVKPLLIIICGLAFLLILLEAPKESANYVVAGAVIFIAIGLVYFIREWIDRITTEFVVTNKRVVKKGGLIVRHTQEMNLAKIESVQFHQGIMGRILNYGAVAVIGTGGSAQIDSGSNRHKSIAAPLKFREAIQIQSHQ